MLCLRRAASTGLLLWLGQAVAMLHTGISRLLGTVGLRLRAVTGPGVEVGGDPG
jgi:hypothetical protein